MRRTSSFQKKSLMLGAATLAAITSCGELRQDEAGLVKGGGQIFSLAAGCQLKDRSEGKGLLPYKIDYVFSRVNSGWEMSIQIIGGKSAGAVAFKSTVYDFKEYNVGAGPEAGHVQFHYDMGDGLPDDTIYPATLALPGADATQKLSNPLLSVDISDGNTYLTLRKPQDTTQILPDYTTVAFHCADVDPQAPADILDFMRQESVGFW